MHQETIYGLLVDDQTRCQHYHSPVDIIAIQFKCCGRFYPCYQCHEACENHPMERWKPHEFDTKAILCGVCRQKMSISEYMAATACPSCSSMLNAGCKKHFHIYFDVEKDEKNDL